MLSFGYTNYHVFVRYATSPKCMYMYVSTWNQMFVLQRFSVNFLSSHVASRDWMTDVKVAEDGFDPASCLDIAKQLVST